MKKSKKPIKAYKNLKFLNSGEARPIRIQAEYFEPYYRFRDFNIESTIVLFGSARIHHLKNGAAKVEAARKACEKNPTKDNKQKLETVERLVRLSHYYDEAVEFSRRITEWALKNNGKEQKYYICSGGGPGIMEAANKGARDAGGRSIGLNISLPMEQFPNPYITPELNFEFHYFFMRKYWFVYFAKAIAIFPGGFGTLDEMMEVLTLIQTRKVLKKMPLIVFGKDYWDDIINLDAMARWGTISPEDLKLFKFVENVDEAFNYLTKRLK